MTNEIEMTKCKLYEEIRRANEMASIQQLRAMGLPIAGIEERLESHLEALRQDRGRLVEERDALCNRVQVLESANKIAGERIKTISKANEMLGSISAHETRQNASCAPLDAKTAAILGAVVDVQRIVTDWATKGLKAKEAMRLVAGVVNGGSCYSAMLAFEKSEKPEISINSIRSMLSKNQPHGGAAIDLALQDMAIHGVGAYRVVVDETTGEALRNRAGWEIRSNDFLNQCQHSFHPSFPGGELCTFCGVAK